MTSNDDNGVLTIGSESFFSTYKYRNAVLCREKIETTVSVLEGRFDRARIPCDCGVDDKTNHEETAAPPGSRTDKGHSLR
jgi:hypothetical protein